MGRCARGEKMSKLQIDTYNKLIDLLAREANNTENEDDKKELLNIMLELDTIGTY